MDATSTHLPDVWQAPSAIESELLWLNALRRDTSLVVSRPVRNREGNWVTQFSNDAFQFQKPLRCTLLGWIAGQHLQTQPTREQSRQVGALMARLHQHASQWQVPQGFNRPEHNAARLQSSLAPLHALQMQGIISAHDYAIFHAAAEEVGQLMRSLERTRETWGLIHADLHDGNYLVHGDEVRPIDFARCGFGFYLYDIGLSLGYIEPPMRSNFLEGYQTVRRLPSDYQRIVEAFWVSSTVENFAFLSTNPQEHEGLAQAVPDVSHQNFRPYLQGEAFLFEK